MYYGLAGIASFALSLFFWWSYSGPYRLIADLQSKLWGVNLINVSLLLSSALLYAPLHFLVSSVERRVGVQRPPLTWKRLKALVDFFFEQTPGRVAGVGLIVFAVGGWLWSVDVTSGPLTTFTVAQAERGERPASRYVRLPDAKVQLDSELSYKRDGTLEHYYPAVSGSAMPEQFRVFVRLDGKDAASPPAEIVGELTFDGLPGPLRAHLADQNLLAPDYFVVRHGRNPGKEARVAGGMAGLGALLFAAGLLWARSRRRTE